ncbi:unnamed protein product [Polarella glacialis]|uniref:Glycosyl transferase 48 domain-containing protein n=1 Tax=Polarella glacialis TaxID=89957 RepID=A0A813D8S7_POLGL|nr:unnamed protein product [Polarella glacialis]
MPELLYFLTELTLDAEEEGPSGVRGHRQSSDFLVSIVRPIYKVVFDEHYQRVDVVNGQHRKVMRPGYETFLPADSSNYDDWNELFCDTDRLTSALVFGAERGQLVALPPARRYAALSRVVWDVSLRGAKTHRELHSMWGVFAAMHRIWFLHVLLYFLSMFWVASRNFHDEQSGWDTLVGGGSPLVCLAAVGLLVPVHAVCWNLARWFVAGRALRDKLLGRGGNSTGCVRCLRSLWLMLSCLLQLALWSLPLVTFELVRWLDAFGKDDPDEKGTHFGFLSLQEALCLHLGMCCCGVLVILLLPARAEDQQWAPTSSHWSLKIGRWLFWGLVLSAKVFSSLEGISAIHKAMDEMKISRLGRESVSDLPRFAFGPMWDKDMIQWLALWGAGFVLFLADTQFWFCLGCSLLAALLALSQRGWQLFSLTFQDAVAAVPELFAERVLLDAAPGRQRPLPWQPRAPSAAGLPRDSARRHQWFSPWFPDIWNRAIEFMRYEDKLDDFMAGQLRFNFNTDDAQQVNWAHLHRRLERRTSFTPPQILRPSSWGQRCLGRDLGWLPDENWPANREVQWRLQGLSRGLFLADLPKPFQTPYLPGFTVMIPHYGESILLCKSDLYASNQGEVVPLISWLAKRYHSEFLAFTSRAINEYAPWPRAGNKWHEYSDEHWVKLCGWASMRSQTLWRTVAGMMLYLDALECHRRVDNRRHSESRLLWDSSEVFTCMVAMQMYASFKPHQLEHTERLFQKFPKSLQVAFIDSKEVGPSAQNDSIHPAQQQRYYSCLVDSSCGFLSDNRRRPRLEIELPGYPILGDGKGDNQNHALPFSRGSIIQTIDANQGAYFEQMLLLPCALGEFRSSWGGRGIEPRIVGFPEHITSDIGSIGDFAAGAEAAFGTTLQRAYSFLGARMHYGHPDMMNKEFMIQQGGVSKATKTVNLSEDIFAGMDFTLRGEGRNIVHREYFHLAKGRDLGFNTVLTFFSKLAAGTGEQILTRQMLRIGHVFDLPELLSFYYAHAGFYLTQFLLSKSIPLLVYIWLVVVLDDPEQNFHAMDNTEVQESGAVIVAKMLVTQYSWLLVLFILAQTAPLFIQIWLESGIIAAFSRVLKQFFTLAPLHFIFQAKVIGIYISRELLHGGASYVATGRGLPTERRAFIGRQGGLYNDFAALAFYDGARLLTAVLIVALAGGLDVGDKLWSALFWWLFAVFLTITSWLFAPFIFNPYQFAYKHFCGDVRDWREFFLGDRSAHWVRWYESSQLKPGSGLRAAPMEVAIWAAYLASFYTILSEKVHMLSVIFTGDANSALILAMVVMPPVLASFLACAGVPFVLRAAGFLDYGDTLRLPQAALMVVVFDSCEAIGGLWKLASVSWWKSLAVGLILKYSLLSLTLLCCECLFRLKGPEPQGAFAHWLKSTVRLWLYAHRMARDVAVSALIFGALSLAVLFDLCRSSLCDGCSLHNILIYRDPGGAHSNRINQPHAAGSESSTFMNLAASDGSSFRNGGFQQRSEVGRVELAQGREDRATGVAGCSTARAAAEDAAAAAAEQQQQQQQQQQQKQQQQQQQQEEDAAAAAAAAGPVAIFSNKQEQQTTTTRTNADKAADEAALLEEEARAAAAEAAGELAAARAAAGPVDGLDALEEEARA